MNVEDVAGRDVQIRLDLPPDFRVVRFSGEEMSHVQSEVEPQHIAPNDAMVFHQEIETCAPDLVDDETEILVLKGIVRPQDVSGDNVVISTDIASTEITYKGKGMVSNYSKPSIITRLLTLFF